MVFKRDHVARFRLDKMSSLRSVLRDSLRSNKSSHRLRRRTQSSHFIANLLAIATLPPPTPPRERDLLSFDLWLLLLSFRPPSRNLIRVIRNDGITGIFKMSKIEEQLLSCNPPTYALMSKGVTKCLFTLWKGLIPFTKLQHRRRPMSGYIRLCKVIYGYVRLCKVICGYGALVEWPWNVGRRSRVKPGMRGIIKQPWNSRKCTPNFLKKTPH